MRYYIPITEGTLPLLAELNNGLAPEIENEHTLFVFEPGEVPEIIFASQKVNRPRKFKGSVPMHFESTE